MSKRPRKIVEMPASNPEAEPQANPDLEELARELFAERKQDVGRVPDRRRPAVPTWRGDDKPKDS